MNRSGTLHLRTGTERLHPRFDRIEGKHDAVLDCACKSSRSQMHWDAVRRKTLVFVFHLFDLKTGILESI